MAITVADKGLVTVFGGSGFLGRNVVRALLKRGWRVRAAVRRPDLAGYLQPLGMVGWVQPIQANVRYRWSVERAVEAPTPWSTSSPSSPVAAARRFDAVNAFGARGGRRGGAGGAASSTLVHVSAIGADPGLASAMRRSKAAGEAAVLETLPDAVHLRPSIMFGPEDHFFNRFAGMARDARRPCR